MKRIINPYFCVGILLFLVMSCSNPNEVADSSPKINDEPAAFWNLTGNIVSHDPCIIQANGTWWAFMTGQGIGIKYSSNGKNWTQGIQRFPGELSWWRQYAPNMKSNDVWAPDIINHNGRYWLYYSVSSFGSNSSAIGLTSCSNITTGDWRDDGVVIASRSTNYNAIDPDVTVDPKTGKLWMTFGSWFDGIKLIEINSSTMKPIGTLYSIARRSGGIEAPDIAYNGGYYYLFVSIDRCCLGASSTYKIAYGRSTSITGPYTSKSGASMLSGGFTVFDAGNTRWHGTGAQDIYNNIIIRHAYDATDNGTPKMLINDLYFSGGWPTY